MPPVTVTFEKRSDSAIRFSKKLGRCIGWGCFSKKAGTEYDDLHGDHFPDDELFAAVGGLMKADFKDREIDIEHLGAAQGSIVTAWAMTEDVAKSLGCDTAGNYGVFVDFEPAAELLKSIEDGDMFALSMFGSARAEPVAKSGADAVAATKRKRVMRDVKLTKWAVCKLPAHEGAGVTLVKTAPSDEVFEAIAKTAPAIARVAVPVPVEKRSRAATTVEYGHQHVLWDIEEAEGFASYETSDASYPHDGYRTGHTHSWLRDTDGNITILVADGHTHTIATEISAMSTPAADIAKAQADITNLQAELTKSKGRLGALSAALLIACSLPPEQAAYASRLTEADRDTFFGKSATERATAATPVFKSVSTGESFFAADDQRLVTMAKAGDATAVELAKAKEAAEVFTFEKRAAAELPHLRGTVAERAAILKAVEGIADEAVRKVALESLKAADAAMAPLFKAVGHGGGGPVGGGALEEFNKGLEAFAKGLSKKADEVADDFLDTDDGQRLYEAYTAETAAQRRIG